MDIGDIWGYIGDILGIYWDNGNDNGNYYLGFRYLLIESATSCSSNLLVSCRDTGVLGTFVDGQHEFRCSVCV